MLDELKSMAVFCKVVECHSFAKAAKELNLSASVISHHISMLERKTGVALLYRSTRRLAVTSEGEQLYRECRLMVQAANRGLSYLNNKSQTPRGTLKICMAQVLAKSPVMQSIAAFSMRYPDVQLSLEMSDKVQNIIEGGYDLALRIGTLKDSNLKAQKIYEIHRVLVGAKSFIEKFAPCEQLADCEKLPFISPSMLNASRTFVKAGQKQKLTFTPRIQVDSVEAACQLAIDGAGITTPPDYLAKEAMYDGRLLALFQEWQCEPLKVYVLSPSNAYENSLSQVFKKFLIQSLAKKEMKNDNELSIAEV